MANEEKIRTLHPQGKNGVNILRRRYDLVKDFVLETIRRHPNITFQELTEQAERELGGKFDGNVSWYVVSVKLDLEARGLVERVPKTSPHQLRLKKE